MKETLLAITAGLFILLILFRFVRGILLGRRISSQSALAAKGAADPEIANLVAEATSPVKARDTLRELEKRATECRAIERSAYYSAAGDLALTVLKRPNVAVSLYLRALRNNPCCESAFDRLREILFAQKKVRRFERTCWTILGRLDDEMVGMPIWIKCWSAIAAIYASSPRTTARADAIRKMLASVTSDEEIDEEGEGVSDTDDDEPSCGGISEVVS